MQAIILCARTYVRTYARAPVKMGSGLVLFLLIQVLLSTVSGSPLNVHFRKHRLVSETV